MNRAESRQDEIIKNIKNAVRMKRTDKENMQAPGKVPEKRSILRMVTDLLRKRGEEDVAAIPSPPPEMVTTLIEKAVPSEGVEVRLQEVNDDNGSDEASEKKGCPYATKRAIVASLQEIRRFAEEHQLASTVIKAMLTLLAEMTLDSLKGRVSGRILEVLFKAICYDCDRKEAYSQGRHDGRNDAIETVVYPPQDKEVPDINGTVYSADGPATIFDIAKGEGN